MATNQGQQTPSNQKPHNANPVGGNYMRYANMGFQMFVIIGLGVCGGIKLDEITHLKFPVFTIILSLISVIVAIYFVIRDLLKK